MTCPACTEAEANPLSGMYHAQCHGCAERSFANSPMFFECARGKAMTASYRQAMQASFGEGWVKAHERVKAWAERIRSTKALDALAENARELGLDDY